MRFPHSQARLPREARLPGAALASVVVAIVVVVLTSPAASGTRQVLARQQVTVAAQPITSKVGSATGGVSATPAKKRRVVRHKPHGAPQAGAGQLTLARAVGQLIVATYPGSMPPSSMLAAVRAGEVGGIILMGNNTAGGVAGTRAAVNELQAAARQGGNPGLLIMTDQEGGEVKRLPGPPLYSAAEMGNLGDAEQQGVETAQLLHEAGVNVDLAPVADVVHVNGFIAQEQRSFGNNPAQAAGAACSFALALAHNGIAYTLKHFPGLGDAVQSTDNVPVNITEPAQEISSDDRAYRECGSGPLALVMVSSASYEHLTGFTPAVLSPAIYHQVMPSDGINAVTISDSFESGAIQNLHSPAMTAINAGLDMVLYPGLESSSLVAFQSLLNDAEQGALNRGRLQTAASKVLAIKQSLNLT